MRHSSVRPGSRHTSPVRPLSTQPDRANRKLDFTHNQSPVAASIERSPTLSRAQPARSAKLQKTRKSIFQFDAFDQSPIKRPHPARDSTAELNKSIEDVYDAVDHITDTTLDSAAVRTSGVAAPDTTTHHETSFVHHPEDDIEQDMTEQEAHTEFEDTKYGDFEEDDDTQMVSENQRASAGAATTSIELDAVPSPSMNTLTSSNQKRKREQPRLTQDSVQNSMSESHMEPTPKRARSLSSGSADYTHASLPDVTQATLADATTFDTQSVGGDTNVEHTIEEPSLADQSTTEYTLDPALAEQTVLEPTYANTTIGDMTAGNVTTVEGHSELSQPTPRSARGRKSFVVQNDDDYTVMPAVDDEPMEAQVDDDASSAGDFTPDLAASREETEIEHDDDQKQQNRPRKKRASKFSTKPKARKAQPAQRDQPRASKQPANSHRESASPESETGAKKKGPRSIVRLRAGTPAEDEGATVTRSGRTSFKPLQYWKSESFTYNHGEIDGIVRASEVPQVKQTIRRGKVNKKKKRAALDSIREEDDEEEEDEELQPEMWESELGGEIRAKIKEWDPETGDVKKQAGSYKSELHFFYCRGSPPDSLLIT